VAAAGPRGAAGQHHAPQAALAAPLVLWGLKRALECDAVASLNVLNILKILYNFTDSSSHVLLCYNKTKA
jgi:hypothetical protein